MRKSVIRKIKKDNSARNLQRMPIVQAEKKKKDNIIFCSAFISCMGLALWSILIYRNTVVDWRHLMLPALIGAGLILGLFFRKLKAWCEKMWAVLFVSLVCGGALVHFLLMFLNQSFADSAIHTEAFALGEKGHLAKGKNSGCAQPYVYVDFHGQNKQLIFFCNQSDKVFSSDSVKLEYIIGLFSWEVIKKKTLM